MLKLNYYGYSQRMGKTSFSLPYSQRIQVMVLLSYDA